MTLYCIWQKKKTTFTNIFKDTIASTGFVPFLFWITIGNHLIHLQLFLLLRKGKIMQFEFFFMSVSHFVGSAQIHNSKHQNLFTCQLNKSKPSGAGKFAKKLYLSGWWQIYISLSVYLHVHLSTLFVSFSNTYNLENWILDRVQAQIFELSPHVYLWPNHSL